MSLGDITTLCKNRQDFTGSSGAVFLWGRVTPFGEDFGLCNFASCVTCTKNSLRLKERGKAQKYNMFPFKHNCTAQSCCHKILLKRRTIFVSYYTALHVASCFSCCRAQRKCLNHTHPNLVFPVQHRYRHVYSFLPTLFESSQKLHNVYT